MAKVNLKSIGANVKELVKKYGPDAVDAMNEISKQTNGAVTQTNAVETVEPYVASNRNRAAIVVESLARGGIPVDEIIPANLAVDADTKKLRELAIAAAQTVAKVYESRADKSLTQGEIGIAKDIIRKRRVQTALSIYGSVERYMDCHPNGGIPVEDFVWYSAIVR